MRRALLWVAYAGYLVTVGYLVWDPRPTVPSSAVLRVTDLVGRVGVGVATTTVEFALNVALFVPMSLLGTFVFRRLRVADWVLVGFVGSFAVELVQRFFLPARNGSSRDIVANTLGALIGAVLAWLALAVLQRQAGSPVAVAAPAPESPLAAGTGSTTAEESRP